MSVSVVRWLGSAAHERWLEAETRRLLEFARASLRPEGGFAWLDDVGHRDPIRPTELWIGCRMTHVFALAHLMGVPGSAHVVDHGLRALKERFKDQRHGGWYGSVADQGVTSRPKQAYGHAFVVLAASSAVAAGRPGARDLLAEAVDVLVERFWDDRAGMMAEEWDEAFQVLDGYRGVNSNMHSVEALMAAHDVTADDDLLKLAARITTKVYGLARGNEWRIPEHFDEAWTPLLDYNQDKPADPFRPYGATIGHWFEWARLGVQLHTSMGVEAPARLVEDAAELFEAAVREGWAVDGTPGFVYTVDWQGRPVVRQRMHWVAAEAVAAAAALWRATGDDRYAASYAEWWDHIAVDFMDRAGGSWWHELNPDLSPGDSTWPGKPDAYHAVHATLLPRLPTSPSVAAALAAGLLD